MGAGPQKILVAIADPQQRAQPHLRKAAQLARRTGARIVLFHATFDPSAFQFGVVSKSFPKAIARVLRERRERLQRLAKSMVPRSVRSSVRVEWDYPPPEAIVREALRSRADLVIAQAGGHSLAARLLLLNNDWQLVEKCPVPLLLVKSARPYSARTRILAAVDPFHVHDKPARLDRRILGQAEVFARALRGTLDVMHAYLPLGAQASVSAVEPTVMAIPAELEERHLKSIRRKFNRLAEGAGIAASRRHLVSDYPTQGIRTTVRKIKAEIVAMGAVSRRGLRAIFIGSSAERVLNRVDCDLLIVKPAAFKTPVSRRVPKPQLTIPWVP